MDSERCEGWQLSCAELKQRGAYLYKSKLWSDCTFQLDDVIVKAHKLLMAMASPVFSKMLYGSFVKFPMPIDDVRPEVFDMLLEYIYSDNLNIRSSKDACDLYNAAKKWRMPYVAKKCVLYLNEHMTPENLFHIYKVACESADTTLQNACEKIFTTKTKEILKDSSFYDTDLSVLTKLFSLEPLNIDNELNLFEAAVKYANIQGMTTRKRSFPPEEFSTPVKKTCRAAEYSQNDKTLTEDCSMRDLEDSPTYYTTEVNETANSAEEIHRDKKEKQIYRDLIKPVRFLTLTPQEFAECQTLPGLLSSSEMLALSMNVASREACLPMPQGFSTCLVPRTLETKQDRTRLAAVFRSLIQNFRNIKKYESTPFYLRNNAWTLMLLLSKENNLVLAVTCFFEAGPPEWVKNAKVKVKFCTHKQVPKHLHKISLRVSDPTPEYGAWVAQVKRSDLLNPDYGFVDEFNTVTYKLYINTVPKPNDSPGYEETSSDAVSTSELHNLMMRVSRTPTPSEALWNTPLTSSVSQTTSTNSMSRPTSIPHPSIQELQSTRTVITSAVPAASRSLPPVSNPQSQTTRPSITTSLSTQSQVTTAVTTLHTQSTLSTSLPVQSTRKNSSEKTVSSSQPRSAHDVFKQSLPLTPMSCPLPTKPSGHVTDHDQVDMAIQSRPAAAVVTPSIPVTSQTRLTSMTSPTITTTVALTRPSTPITSLTQTKSSPSVACPANTKTTSKHSFVAGASCALGALYRVSAPKTKQSLSETNSTSGGTNPKNLRPLTPIHTAPSQRSPPVTSDNTRSSSTVTSTTAQPSTTVTVNSQTQSTVVTAASHRPSTPAIVASRRSSTPMTSNNARPSSTLTSPATQPSTPAIVASQRSPVTSDNTRPSSTLTSPATQPSTPAIVASQRSPVTSDNTRPSSSEASPATQPSTPAIVASRRPSTPLTSDNTRPSSTLTSPATQPSTPAIVASRRPSTPLTSDNTRPSSTEASPATQPSTPAVVPSRRESTPLTSDNTRPSSTLTSPATQPSTPAIVASRRPSTPLTSDNTRPSSTSTSPDTQPSTPAVVPSRRESTPLTSDNTRPSSTSPVVHTHTRQSPNNVDTKTAMTSSIQSVPSHKVDNCIGCKLRDPRYSTVGRLCLLAENQGVCCNIIKADGNVVIAKCYLTLAQCDAFLAYLKVSSIEDVNIRNFQGTALDVRRILRPQSLMSCSVCTPLASQNSSAYTKDSLSTGLLFGMSSDLSPSSNISTAEVQASSLSPSSTRTTLSASVSNLTVTRPVLSPKPTSQESRQISIVSTPPPILCPPIVNAPQTISSKVTESASTSPSNVVTTTRQSSPVNTSSGKSQPTSEHRFLENSLLMASPQQSSVKESTLERSLTSISSYPIYLPPFCSQMNEEMSDLSRDTITVSRPSPPVTTASQISIPLHAITLAWPTKRKLTTSHSTDVASKQIRLEEIPSTTSATVSVSKSADPFMMDNPTSHDDVVESRAISETASLEIAKEAFTDASTDSFQAKLKCEENVPGAQPKTLQAVAFAELGALLQTGNLSQENEPERFQPKSLQAITISKLGAFLQSGNLSYEKRSKENTSKDTQPKQLIELAFCEVIKKMSDKKDIIDVFSAGAGILEFPQTDAENFHAPKPSAELGEGSNQMLLDKKITQSLKSKEEFVHS